MSARAILHVIIRGRVQGVGYRAWVEQQAVAAKLEGWVRNRRDGTVEAHVQGDADAVDRVLRWCRSGPAGAEVTGVEITECAQDPALTRFQSVATA
jgi:acylphosphatase